MTARAPSCFAKAYLDNSFPSNKLRHLLNLAPRFAASHLSASYLITVQIASKIVMLRSLTVPLEIQGYS